MAVRWPRTVHIDRPGRWRTLSLRWGRERGVWVVRQITETYYIPRRLLGTVVGGISPDTTAYSWLPEERRYAVATEWYRTPGRLRGVVVTARRGASTLKLTAVQRSFATSCYFGEPQR